MLNKPEWQDHSTDGTGRHGTGVPLNLAPASHETSWTVFPAFGRPCPSQSVDSTVWEGSRRKMATPKNAFPEPSMLGLWASSP